ncbi:MAG TPA: isocitrate lyase, partial [Acidimicrobiia bacterium]|nr:isocitrate lyase [Acidimicrobiia bacterium]
MTDRQTRIADLEQKWADDSRWGDITRRYTAAEVIGLRGSMLEEHTLARAMAERLRTLIDTSDYVNAL